MQIGNCTFLCEEFAICFWPNICSPNNFTLGISSCHTSTGLYEKCFSSTRIHSFISYLVKSKLPHMVDKTLLTGPILFQPRLSQCALTCSIFCLHPYLGWYSCSAWNAIPNSSLPSLPWSLLILQMQFRCLPDSPLTPLSISGICPHKSLCLAHWAHEGLPKFIRKGRLLVNNIVNYMTNGEIRKRKRLMITHLVTWLHEHVTWFGKCPLTVTQGPLHEYKL